MGTIRIGNQTAFSTLTPIEPFEYAIENGFNTFEWFPDKNDSGIGWDIADLDHETINFIKNTSIEKDISLSVHVPWWANPLKYESHNLLLDHFRFAQNIGAVLLNMHFYIDEGIDPYVKAIIPFIKLSAEIGIRLSIENSVSSGPEDFNRMFALIKDRSDVIAGHVGMCLDLGHANLHDSTRNDYLRFIDHLGSHVPIMHVHLHENYGDQDSHLTIFTGPAGENDTGIRKLIKYLKRRNFSGSIILEQWPKPPSLLIQARDKLYKTLGYKNEPKLRTETLVKKKKSKSIQNTGHSTHNIHHLKRDDFVESLVEANQCCRSWREKLLRVQSFFADDSFEPDNEQLIYLAIYLRFLSAGEIPCAEDSRHFRPHHHAKMSQKINERLAEITTPGNAFIIRKIYPSLPSYDSDFMRAEPLTRIRDIAHRNDIPKELKKEIKHTLQNKLHRCAGPEDLLTSTNILERITDPNADYSTAFVEQFKIFHEELQEFFNAKTLDERLNTMIKREDSVGKKLIREFLKVKNKKAKTLQNFLTTFKLLTELRYRYTNADNKEGAEVQNIRLTDIGLEDYAFVLLSEMMNVLEAVNDETNWDLMLHFIALTVRNLLFSGIDKEECKAIESELKAWHKVFDYSNTQQLLRLKATLDRCMRLTTIYSEKVLKLFPEKVEKLGYALGVAEHSINVFCEADIRSNLILQLSKLVSSLLKKVRTFANLSLWDVIVTGKTTGCMVSINKLVDLKDSPNEQFIVLLKEAEGDEVISNGVAGVILQHEVPHLSHLVIRARQENVILVVCEDENRTQELENLAGKQINLDVNPDSVKWEVPNVADVINKEDQKEGMVCLPEIDLNFQSKLLAIDKVTIKNGGSKANVARQLEKLSRYDGAGFKTPPGYVIPFGAMEEVIWSKPTIEEELNRLVNRLNDESINNFTESLKRIRELIIQIDVHDDIIHGISESFSKNSALMVRSSSNCEDMKEMAGAGLYDSFANVLLPDASDAIKKVWASLWTKRATMSRMRSGLPHNKAHMAVLIQQMIIPDYSFVIHTVNPINYHFDEIYMELAVGLGETLASGNIKGTPFRMICNKNTGNVKILTFASFSHALLPGERGIYKKTIDYSKVKLSNAEEIMNTFGKRLADISRFVEDALGQPQDIEGAIVGEDIYLVQSRPQLGIKALN